jgi:hypothetical protein
MYFFHLILDGNAGNASNFWKVGCFDATTQIFSPVNTYDIVDATVFANQCGALFNYYY